MRLELESIDIRDIKSSDRTYAQDHVLYVDLGELERSILEDRTIESVELCVLYPGDRVRVLNLNDVIQPRCKVGIENRDFPGWLGNINVAGEGKTRSLNGVAVLICEPTTRRKYAALLDMSGKGAILSRYARMRNLCVVPWPAPGTDPLEFENSAKRAGLKAAVYLARAGDDHPADHVDVYDLNIPGLAGNSCLPRVAYYYQMYTPQRDFQKKTPDPIFYGTEIGYQLPSIIHPNEVLDGGMVNMHTVFGLDTYSIQNNAVIKELYARHGTDLLFVGVVCGVANMEPVQRQRMAMRAAVLASNVLGADGIVLTKILGGMTHVDIGLTANACEQAGVKTTSFMQLMAGDGTVQDQIIFLPKSVNAVVNSGNTIEITDLPLDAETFLAGTADTRIYNPDQNMQQKAGDAVIWIQEHLIAGIHDHLGSSRIRAIDY